MLYVHTESTPSNKALHILADLDTMEKKMVNRFSPFCLPVNLVRNIFFIVSSQHIRLVLVRLFCSEWSFLHFFVSQVSWNVKKKKKKAHLFYYQKHLKCQKCSDISRIKHKYRMRLLLLDATPFNLIGTVLLLITNEKAIHFASYSKCSWLQETWAEQETNQVTCYLHCCIKK